MGRLRDNKTLASATTRLERIKPASDWNTVDWRKTERNVRRLRGRIFRAEKKGDKRKVYLLQKLMLRSHSNRLSAVRRVAQTNKGKNTPGVDRVIVKTPAERGRLVDTLDKTGRVMPARRVWIPKKKNERRPLGIPVIRERAEQAVSKNALEPQWEARFEGCSYGFRPGRGCHDALVLIHARVRWGRMPYVLDADIKGAFDNINHDFLLNAIGDFPWKEKIRGWLKAGVMEGLTYEPTETGTPQGGVISPLLANIALHGMERVLPQGRLVRYADDFVIFAKSRAEAEALRELVVNWLAKRGLKLSEEKTAIRNVHDGFDFLGCTIRRFYTPGRKRVDRNRLFASPKEGYTTIIKPSKESVQRLRSRLREIVRKYGSLPQAALIPRLNPMLVGWANYFRPHASKAIFGKVDAYLWQLLWRWACRRHPNKGKYWIADRYWGQFAPGRKDRWIFGCSTPDGRNIYLRRTAWIPIVRHEIVPKDFSRDDPALVEYWLKRAERRSQKGALPFQRTLTVLQKGLCPVCGCEIDNDERVEIDHIIPRHKGGSNHVLNKQLLHYFCHQQKTLREQRERRQKQTTDLFQ